MKISLDKKHQQKKKLIFLELSIKNPHSFLLFDQIKKIFGAEIYQMTTKCFKLEIFFEIEKIQKYLKTVADIEKLEGNLYFFSKTFLEFFFRKNPPKCLKKTSSLMQELQKFTK